MILLDGGSCDDRIGATMPEVWAPFADRVDLVSHGERFPLRRDASGWWRCARPSQPGDEYQFSVDAGPPRPDPRSAWQPHGVHGPSRIVDHSQFAWSDEE